MAEKTAVFTNFTTEVFTGYWDGKPKKFKPGQSMFMPEYLARHFAKHLVNRELLRTDKHQKLIYPNGDKMTSPKRPEDFPVFIELFNKAFQIDSTEQPDEQNANEVEVDALNKNKAIEETSELKTPLGDEEDEFENKPKT
jgi:hypothetical protein